MIHNTDEQISVSGPLVLFSKAVKDSVSLVCFSKELVCAQAGIWIIYSRMSLILALQDLIKVQINERSYNFNELLLAQAITLPLNYYTSLLSMNILMKITTLGGCTRKQAF